MNRPSRFLILFNPAAGTRRSGHIAASVDTCLRQAGLDSRTQQTYAPGEAERIARDAIAANKDEPLCIVACGGDGTVQQVANAIAHSNSENAILGLAPAGRCNDFARALGVKGSPDEVAQVLKTALPRPIDLGRVGDRFFCTVAAIGFDASVSRYVNDMRIPLRGPPAYVYGTLQVLRRYQAPTLRLSGDFGRHEGPVFLAATANTPWYGGSMNIAPDADPFDGQIDICLVTKVSRARVLRLLPRVMAGSHVAFPEVRMLRSRSLSVSEIGPPTNLEVWADGEPLGKLPVEIKSAANAIEILIPDQNPCGSQ